jgi:urease accessory protein
MAMAGPTDTIIRTVMVRMGTAMHTDTGAGGPDAVLVLHQLLSPAFPVGAFAYSQGLETAVQDGTVQTPADVSEWISVLLEHGGGWSDTVFAARAALGDDLEDLSALARALAPSAERRQETVLMGDAFASTVRDVWGVAVPPAPYPVAYGAAVRALSLPVDEALRLFLLSVAANVASAGVRLVPLGQTDGQRIVHGLHALCAELATRALDTDLDDLGGFAPMLDIQSQRHDTLYSRLFRS